MPLFILGITTQIKTMNKLIFFLLIPIYLFSQSKVAQEVKTAQALKKRFTNVDLIDRRLKGKDISALKIGVLAMHPQTLTKLVNDKPNQISITLPKNARENVKLKLVKVNLQTNDFKVNSENGQLSYIPGVHYRGIVQGTNEVATLSIFHDGIIGNFSNEEENIAIAGIPSALEIKKDTSIRFTCGSDKLEKIPQPLFKLSNDLTTQNVESKCVRIYLECDYALFQNKGSSVNTVNWITSVFNNVAALYANESINIKISEVYVWTTADPYPRTSSYEALDKFRKTRPTFNGDLAHLCALGGQGLGGVAWLGTLCIPGYNYAYSNIQASFNNAPTYSWTVMVMAHEQAHSLGGWHTHSCNYPGGAIDGCYTQEGNCAKGPLPPPGGQGTILSYCHLTQYGINFNLGFGKLPGDKIRQGVANASCLQSNCTPPPSPCNFPLGLSISEITSTTAKASWQNSIGATNYIFEYKPNASTTWQGVSTPLITHTMTLLQAATIYNTRIKSVCQSGQSVYSSVMNFTTLSAPPPPPPPPSGVYCSSKGNSVNYEYLGLVKLGSINCSTTIKKTGYIDYTALSTDLTRGSIQTINYQSKTIGKSNTLYWRIYADYNNDKDFLDPGEQIVSIASANMGLLSSNFTVPNTAILGKTRLRIIMRYGGFAASCGNYSYGQTQDFSINIK